MVYRLFAYITNVTRPWYRHYGESTVASTMFQYALSVMEPALFEHLEALGVHPMCYAYSPIVLFFARQVPPHLLGRLWDCVFCSDEFLFVFYFMASVVVFGVLLH